MVACHDNTAGCRDLLDPGPDRLRGGGGTSGWRDGKDLKDGQSVIRRPSFVSLPYFLSLKSPYRLCASCRLSSCSSSSWGGMTVTPLSLSSPMRR